MAVALLAVAAVSFGFDHMVLTVRTNLSAVDAGGTLGVDGIDVEVILHRGTSHEKSLGKLEGSFGSGWQTVTLDVDVLDVRFPADPCRGQDASAPCGQVPVPRPNEFSFQFTGNIPFRLTFELDWLTLEPKDQPGLAWRPVLLAHGWRGGPDDMVGPTPSRAEPPGASASPQGTWASPPSPSIHPFGTIRDNAATFSAAVADLKQRFGVERVNVVGYCKGGIDAREHVRRNDDVDRLLMVATPQAGSFLVDSMLVSPNTLIWEGEDPKKAASSLRELSGPRIVPTTATAGPRVRHGPAPRGRRQPGPHGPGRRGRHGAVPGDRRARRAAAGAGQPHRPADRGSDPADRSRRRPHPPMNAGPASVTGYSIQVPETGSWTLEVTGTGVPSPDTAYAVAALAQLPPGTGVVLAAAADQDQYVVGEPVTITATLTADGYRSPTPP